jgi:hypothetical protein
VGGQVICAGGGQELVEQPLQLLALPAGHPEQLLLLSIRERLGSVLQGQQGAKQRGQRPAQFVGEDGQQLLGVLGGRLLARERRVGHREHLASCSAPPGRHPGTHGRERVGQPWASVRSPPAAVMV